jgi:hypothetical protein
MAPNVGIIIAELATAITMIVPKAIRAIGEILQVLGITLHDVGYAFLRGRRRPRNE